MPDPDILVCLDPGTTTGVAYLRLGPNGAPAEVDHADALPIADVLDGLRSGDLVDLPGFAALVFEDTRSLPVYARNRRGPQAEQGKRARDVGRIDAMCDLIEHYARAAGLPLIASVPSGPKWDADQCRLLTGYDGSPNNAHVRDAIRAGWTVGPVHVREARRSALGAPIA